MNDELRSEHVEPKGNKKVQELVRGSLLVMLGAWMATGIISAILYILRTPSINRWFIGDTLLRAAAAAFFILVGARAIRGADQKIPPTRIGWGRLLFGVVLIYLNIRQQFVPNPNALQPANEMQAHGMQATNILLWIVGVLLILAAFLKKKPEAKALPETSPLTSDTRPS